MTNITQHFHAPVGSATGSGDIHADTINAINGITDEQFRAICLGMLGIVQSLPSSSLKDEGANIVAQAAKQPSQTRLERMIGWLQKAKVGAETTEGIVKAADGLIETIQSIDLSG